nr:hypothetical protein [uncultured Noviherbaspirillum sp.]
MNYKGSELLSSCEPSSLAHSVSTAAKWRLDGPFIVDGTGVKVALMQGEPAEYEWPQRRLLAAVNALQDTPTQFIEELIEQCPDNIILELVTRDKEMTATLQQMNQKIAAHYREIEQLREIMEACRIFEEQRALLQQKQGSTEYEALLRTLGIREAENKYGFK